MSDAIPMSRLMQGVIPYLAYDKADDAIAFYETAFGAVQRGEATRNDEGRVLNASLEINGGCLMLMDRMNGTPAPRREDDNGLTLQIVSGEGRRMWDRAVSAGCTIAMPFERQFWGDDYGRLVDPFGLTWAVMQPSAENLAAHP